MIAVRLQNGLTAENPVKHEGGERFYVDDGWLFVVKDNERIAAYPTELIVSVVKEDCCSKH